MLQSFLHLPTFIMILAAVIISSSVSFIALLFIRKKVDWESFKENHEVGGFLFNALGLIYAVLIAFVVYASWQEYNTAQEICDKEANLMLDLYLNVDGLPEQYRTQIKENVILYLRKVIDDDWPLLDEDKRNPETRQILLDIWKIYVNMDSLDTEKEKIFYTVSVSRLDEITEYSRLRILSGQNHIPVVIWTVILIGAFTSVGFSLFFGTRNVKVQAAMTSLFALTNAIIIVLILNLDHPYTGDIKIRPDPFEEVLENILKLDDLNNLNR
ncbi:MAG TPA: DUF4239 domain-containing protein [Ignavibacteria bacterium]|nr:DUF4239 domain-containing protein [Ignavibacteria bacterium]HMR40918.1 DUF4239 domain-containing protein [Ignavibacteria bacterium]